MKWKQKVMGGGGGERRAQAEQQVAKAACEAAGGSARLQWMAKQYGKGPMPCGSETTPLSIAAVEKGQVVWPGNWARLSATLSAVGQGGRGELSSVTIILRGQGGANERSQQIQGKTDTGGAEHTQGMSKFVAAALRSRQGGVKGREPAAS
jgi:hypothetical protein